MLTSVLDGMLVLETSMELLEESESVSGVLDSFDIVMEADMVGIELDMEGV